MSSSEDDARAATLRLVSAYGALLGQKRWDEWIELWAEDGELRFPFAPLGRKSICRGRAEILAYMSAAGRVVADTHETVRLYPMQNPHIAVMELTVKGHTPSTGAPYNQTFVLFLETKGGKIWRYREYWNPLVTIDALGGRETWTDGFGSPDPTRDAWGS
jgi:uncharacterized protein